MMRLDNDTPLSTPPTPLTTPIDNDLAVSSCPAVVASLLADCGISPTDWVDLLAIVAEIELFRIGKVNAL